MHCTQDAETMLPGARPLGWSGQSVLVRAGETVIAIRGHVDPARSGADEPPSTSGAAPDKAVLEAATSAEISKSPGAALCKLAEQFNSVSEQILTMSPHEAEALVARIVDSLIVLTRNIHPDRTLPSSREQSIRFTVEKFINTRLSSPGLSPKTIAQDLEIPRSTLYKAFTDVGGIVNYIQDKRLTVAKSLLLRPEEYRSLGEIASSLGFVSCATFSKAFKRKFNRSPRSIRALSADHTAALRRDDTSRADREGFAA